MALQRRVSNYGAEITSYGTILIDIAYADLYIKEQAAEGVILKRVRSSVYEIDNKVELLETRRGYGRRCTATRWVFLIAIVSLVIIIITYAVSD